MPANSSSYYQSKYASLQALKSLMLEERQAIIAADMPILTRVMQEIEIAQSSIESLDADWLGKENHIQPSSVEADSISGLQREVVLVENENIRLLVEHRDAILAELKALRTKRNAGKAYMPAQERRVMLSESR